MNQKNKTEISTYIATTIEQIFLGIGEAAKKNYDATGIPAIAPPSIEGVKQTHKVEYIEFEMSTGSEITADGKVKIFVLSVEGSSKHTHINKVKFQVPYVPCAVHRL